MFVILIKKKPRTIIETFSDIRDDCGVDKTGEHKSECDSLCFTKFQILQ